MNPFRLFLALIPFLLSALQTNPPTGDDGEEGEGKDGDQKDDKSRIEWTPEQQAAISRIAAREARKAADKARQEEKDRIAQEKTDADTEAARKRQQEAGEFDQVKQSLEGERDTIKGERDGLKAENDALTAYFTGRYDAALTELPDTILAFKPADDASVTAKSEWLTKAQEQAKKLGTTGNPGNRENPNPGGRQFNIDEEATKARASGRYSI